MKWVFLSLNILLFNSTNFYQEVISDPEHEIFCGSENYNSQLTYKLEPIGIIWDVYWPNATTHIFTIDTDGSSNGGIFIAESNRPISFWQNCLVLIPTTNNHPRIVWGPHPTVNVSSYRIYRVVSNTPVNKPMTLSYSLIQQNIPSTTFEFTDYAVDMISGYQYAYYYVKAYNGSTESSETNYVGTPAQFNKESPNVVIIPKENILFQNYPNPFNPTTSIQYAITNRQFVTLKVYDVLGKVVATLVNEEKPVGNYSLSFDASNLSSGVYLYTIKSGSFVQTRKMLLMK